MYFINDYYNTNVCSLFCDYDKYTFIEYPKMLSYMTEIYILIRLGLYHGWLDLYPGKI